MELCLFKSKTLGKASHCWLHHFPTSRSDFRSWQRKTKLIFIIKSLVSTRLGPTLLSGLKIVLWLNWTFSKKLSRIWSERKSVKQLLRGWCCWKSSFIYLFICWLEKWLFYSYLIFYLSLKTVSTSLKSSRAKALVNFIVHLIYKFWRFKIKGTFSVIYFSHIVKAKVLYMEEWQIQQ